MVARCRWYVAGAHLQEDLGALKFSDLASVKQQYPICVDDGVQPMRNGQAGAALEGTPYCPLYRLISVVIDIAGGLIQHLATPMLHQSAVMHA